MHGMVDRLGLKSSARKSVPVRVRVRPPILLRNGYIVKKLKIKTRVPILSWCNDLEEGALKQAIDLANHPVVVGHIALMSDCHTGFGMPIGGVIACKDAVIPNAVGVDIGCGMGVIQTNLKSNEVTKPQLRLILDKIKELIPMGKGYSHKEPYEDWDYFFSLYETTIKGQHQEKTRETASRNLGTLGGGNHFIEIQVDNNGFIWLMLHSGSRNLGYQIAKYHHNISKTLNKKWHSNIPCEDLAFLPIDSNEGKSYLTDMCFAMEYARLNRDIMMSNVRLSVKEVFPDVKFDKPINIHHNYASLEHHFGQNLWVHRKGATSAKIGQKGIIPGAMGSYSYIVEGLDNAASLKSCSHGAGRVMSRTQASATLSRAKCDEAMHGIVWDGFKKRKSRKKQEDSKYDLSEAPHAYKDIRSVMEAQQDLVKILVELKTLAVLKG